MVMDWLFPPQARRCRSGYPVASAGLSLSGPGAGVHVEPEILSVPQKRDTKLALSRKPNAGRWRFSVKTRSPKDG